MLKILNLATVKAASLVTLPTVSFSMTAPAPTHGATALLVVKNLISTSGTLARIKNMRLKDMTTSSKTHGIMAAKQIPGDKFSGPMTTIRLLLHLKPQNSLKTSMFPVNLLK